MSANKEYVYCKSVFILGLFNEATHDHSLYVKDSKISSALEVFLKEPTQLYYYKVNM